MSARWRSTLRANGFAAFSRALVERRREPLRRSLGLRHLCRSARDALVRALALGQLQRSRFGARAQIGCGLGPEAAAQVRQLLQPLLDAVEHGRVGVEARQIGAQLRRGLAQLLGDAGQLVGRAGERRVVVADAIERVRRFARLGDRARALVGIEQIGSRARRLQQYVEMAQPAALAHELVLLARLRVDLRHRLRERAQLGQPRLLARGAALGIGERAPGGASARQAACISLRAKRACRRPTRRAGRAAPPAARAGAPRAGTPSRSATGRCARGRRACSCGRRAARASGPRARRGGRRRRPRRPRGELGELLGQLDVGERGLHVGLGGGRADQRGVGPAAEQQPTASARIVLPAPVSPVSTFRPGCRSDARSARARGSRRPAPRASASEGVAIALQERDLGQQPERGALGREGDRDRFARREHAVGLRRRRGSRAPAARGRGWRPRRARRAPARAAAP